MSAPGLLLAGRYRLESRIAAGGVGEVWRAQDLVLARPVAVKLLQQGYASHPETLARFRAEARHAGSLTHPGIAQVYDYGESGPAGAPYLVLELVDGPSLAGSLAAGPLGSAAAMDVVAQVAGGLAAAHAAGLVHRDVKPANLLMGRDGLVKITDFGIAHAAGSAPITQAGTLVGTPAYLAPERAAGQPATPASDLYSLGIVAFECLTGTLPFHGTPLEIASASRLQPLPPLPPAVPAAVAALVIDLTAKNPADRPGSAAEVATRAARLRDTPDAGLRPAPYSRPGTAAMPPGRPPAPAHTAVLPDPQAPATEMLDWPSAGPGPGWPDGPEPGRPYGPGPGRPGRARAAWVAGLAAVVLALAAWLLASAGRGPSRPATPPPQASPAASTQGPAAVTVNAAALVGHPVGAVRLRLARLGLRSQVVRSVTGGQRPGTVVSVQPSGRVALGSVITVAAAVRPGHRHHQDKHHGDGNGGNGQGGD
jgi:serine/threonine-protein kinase